MAPKKKYYVVWKGRKTGIFDNWNDCKAQVEGLEGAQYKSFPTKAEAEKALKQGFQKSKSKVKAPQTNEIIHNSIAVDAACSGNPGVMEYRGVYLKTNQVLFHQGPFSSATNNIGEFLAIVHALAMTKKQGTNTPIYSDSGTALAWVRKKKANSKLPREPKTEKIWDLIERAENWLKENTYSNPIYKWPTEKWGEIPADFGRK